MRSSSRSWPAGTATSVKLGSGTSRRKRPSAPVVALTGSPPVRAATATPASGLRVPRSSSLPPNRTGAGGGAGACTAGGGERRIRKATVTGTASPEASRPGSKTKARAAATAAESKGSPAPSSTRTASTRPVVATSTASSTTTSGEGKAVPAGSTAGTSCLRTGGEASPGSGGRRRGRPARAAVASRRVSSTSAARGAGMWITRPAGT